MLFCLWNQTKAYTLSGELHNIFQGLCIIRKAQRSPIPLVEFENDIATILVDFYRWWPLKVLAASSCHRCLQFTVNLTREERMKEFCQVELFFKKKIARWSCPTWANLGEDFLSTGRCPPNDKKMNLIENLGLRGSERWPILCQRLLHP